MARKPNLIGLEKGRKKRTKNILKKGGKPMTARERVKYVAARKKANPLWVSILDEENNENTDKK